jgi:phosphatidylglycerophosphatase C
VQVVFDLDGVIASHDTMAVLVRRQLLSSPRRAIAGLFPALGWSLLRGVPALRVRFSRMLGRVALARLTSEQYRRLAQGIGVELGADPAWTIPQGLAAVRRHLAAGDDVVVTTGTEFLLARAFLDALGLDGVDLVATTARFDGDVGGDGDDDRDGASASRPGRAGYDNHNLGAQKVNNLARREIDLFYTDSDLDLPVAALAAHTILVNPDSRLVRLFSSRVASLEVVRWESTEPS